MARYTDTDRNSLEMQADRQKRYIDQLIQSSNPDSKAILATKKAAGYDLNTGYRDDSKADLSQFVYLPDGTQTVRGYTPSTAKSLSNSNATSYTNANNSINSNQDPLVTALKERLQQNISNRKAQSQPLRDNSEVSKANELRMILEQNANAGDKGGTGRQNALETQTAGENRLNQINLAEATDIANMQSDANVQEANIMAQREQEAKEEQRYQDQLAYQRLRDSIMDNRYTDETAYNREQNQFKNDLTLAELLGMYNETPTMAKQNFDRNILESDRNYNRSVLESDRAYNYQVQQDALNRKYEEEQRAIENALKNKSLSLEGARLSLARAQDRRDADMAALDRQYKQLQINNYNQPTSYKNNPDFADEINYIGQNPATSEQEILANSKALIQKYGYDGYNELLRAARGVY